jgi:hypothetical protein
LICDVAAVKDDNKRPVRRVEINEKMFKKAARNIFSAGGFTGEHGARLVTLLPSSCT